MNPWLLLLVFLEGGWLLSLFSYGYPDSFWAVVINTGMIHEDYQDGKKYYYPRNKIAMFLASPADFRYNQMESDRSFLGSIGWKTKWIEFEGSHRIAPKAAYETAAEWLFEQMK